MLRRNAKKNERMYKLFGKVPGEKCRATRKRGYGMTVKELRDILKDFDDDVDVMTKKTEIFGNIGCVNSVRKDSYGFFGVDTPCVLLTDEYESQESEEV